MMSCCLINGCEEGVFDNSSISKNASKVYVFSEIVCPWSGVFVNGPFSGHVSWILMATWECSISLKDRSSNLLNLFSRREVSLVGQGILKVPAN